MANMNVLIVEGDLTPLLKRLKKGSIVKGRIVQVLAENYYLLRIFGHNLVMKSSLKFNRLQEVSFKVQEAKNKIKLRVFDPQREFFNLKRESLMNILIE